MLEWITGSSILTAVVIALRFAFKGKISLRLQYGLWVLVLVRLLVPFSFESAGINVVSLADALFDGSSESSAAPDSEAGAVNAGEISPSDTDGGSTRDTVAAAKLIRTLKVIWAVGASVVFLAFAAINLSFTNQIKFNRRPVNTGNKPPIYVSDMIEAPCLFGPFHPAIYVTTEVLENPVVFYHTTVHETVHLRHGDNIWPILRVLCLALHWYNPLVWWAAFLSRQDAETACDEAVIKLLGEGERAEYGRTLISMTCNKRPEPFVASTMMTGGVRSIKERITFITQNPKTRTVALAAVILTAAVTVVFTFTGAERDGPWKWSRSVILDSCDSIEIWYNSAQDGYPRTISLPIPSEETAGLNSILTILRKDAFTLNTENAGITPGYGLALTLNGKSVYINEADSPGGNFEMEYGGQLWWIDSPELEDFVTGALKTGPNLNSPMFYSEDS